MVSIVRFPNKVVMKDPTERDGCLHIEGFISLLALSSLSLLGFIASIADGCKTVGLITGVSVMITVTSTALWLGRKFLRFSWKVTLLIVSTGIGISAVGLFFVYVAHMLNK